MRIHDGPAHTIWRTLPPVEFIYVKIPVTDALASREHAIHEALETALAAASAGALIGWGASLDTLPARHHSRIAFHRIDIEVADAELARAVLRIVLTALALPIGTELHFTENGTPLREVSGADAWSAPQPVRAAST